MTSDSFERSAEIFDQARQLTGDARERFMDKACGSDVTLRELVDALLHTDAVHDSPIDSPVIVLGGSDIDFTAASSIPVRIGQYEIVRVLGEGGMGIVYEAEQRSPRRRVALKVIRSGHMPTSVLRRFQHESEFLGRVEHPCIAHIYEAGSAEVIGAEGQSFGAQPFFAMEFVEGPSLIDFVTEHDICTKGQLELFAKVCDAIQFAHHNGVIHRDLKPANILVGSDGTPKILDFGVAKATDSDIRVTTVQTDIGQLIGTVPYMSPEQVQGDPSAIDTRSDVYALGVILYELLSGQLPYDLKEQPIPEAARIIRDEDPIRLSQVNRVYRGDLETIVDKALRKHHEERYQTAGEFAADIRRYLNQEPIVARPMSTMYQLRKFSQRHRAFVSAVGVVFVTLVIAIIGISVSLFQAQRDRDEARHQYEVAIGVVDFLKHDLFEKADPYQAAGPSVTLLSVLDQASVTIEDRFEDEPEVNARLRDTLGSTYFNLGQREAAERHLRTAADLFEQTLGRTARETLAARRLLGRTLIDLREFEEAEEMLTGVLKDAQSSLGPRDSLVSPILDSIATLHKRLGHLDAAEDFYRQSIDVARHNYSGDDRRLLIAQGNLGSLLRQQKKYEEAESIFRQLVDAFVRIRGDDHADTAFARHNLAVLLRELRRYDEAAPEYEAAHAIRVRVFGADHSLTLNTLYELGAFEYGRGNFEKVVEIESQVLEGRLKHFGATHPDVLNTRNVIAMAHLQMQQFAKAEPILRDITEVAERTLGPEHSIANVYRRNLIGVLRSQQNESGLLELYQHYFVSIEKALENSTDPRAHRAFAWDLLNCEVRSLRDADRAIKHSSKAVNLMKRDDPVILDTHALALYRTGSLDDAIDVQRRAVALVDRGNQQMRQTLESRLVAYLEKRHADVN